MLRRLAEPAAFLSLATALHAAVWVGLPGGGREGAAPSGGDGAGAVTLAAAPALQGLVEDWSGPPEVAESHAAPRAPAMAEAAALPQADLPVARPVAAAPPAAVAPDRAATVPPPPPAAPRPEVGAAPTLAPPAPASAPDRPAAAEGPRPTTLAAAPQMPAAPDAPPDADRAPPPSPLAAEVARADTPRPAPRPAPRPDPAPPAPPSIAAGTGKAPVAGAAGARVAAEGAGQAGQGTLAAGARAAALADWAGGIRTKVERRKAYPRAARASRAAGTVTLRLVVAADGSLVSVAVAQGSGHAALDAAALEAVTRAGRFPPAPAALGPGRQSFTLPLRFTP